MGAVWRCTQRARRNRLDTGHSTRAGVRTSNIYFMSVTLEVSRLSGWLNADASCRARPRHVECDRESWGVRGCVAAEHARTYICHMPVYYYAYVYLKVARVPVVRKPSCAETCLRTRTRNTLHLCESDWLDAFVSECCSTLALRSFGKGSSASRALSSHVKIGRPATRLYFCS